MKITVVTFQFAHNYGALLQAFALKTYLQSIGHSVDITPFYPQWAQLEYTINPFDSRVPLRRRIRLALQYKQRKKLSKKFEEFMLNELALQPYFKTEEELQMWLRKYDYVICGSDQIWNDSITGDTGAYYAAECEAKKISYAASLGTLNLTGIQKKYMKKYLPDFLAISVREPQSAILIEEYLHLKSEVVLDPVFLICESEWKHNCMSVGNMKKPFLLLYFLEENQELLDYAIRYAKENRLALYDIHPTLARRHEGFIRLDGVGPKEFLWLIYNAECVCTNSFHATSFSVIFKKKLLHIPNHKSPERTVSLLNRVGVTLKKEGELPLYDIKRCEEKGLIEEIQRSKDFLHASLK